MSSLSLLTVVFAAYLLQSITCAPHLQKRQAEKGTESSTTYTIPGRPTVPTKCNSAPDGHGSQPGWEYCDSFNYYGTLFPNPRQITILDSVIPTDPAAREKFYRDEAFGEFSQFIPLLETGCHPKLPTLLCTFYFSLCYEKEDLDQPGATEVFLVTPCKSLCEEVTSACSGELANLGFQWAPQFNCSPVHKTTLGTSVYPESSSVNEDSDCIDDPPPTHAPKPATEALPTTAPVKSIKEITEAMPTKVCDICQSGKQN